MKECIICNDCDSKDGDYVENPTISSLENLLDRTRERHKFKDPAVQKFVERTEGLSAENLKNNNSRYHRKCYSSYANKDKVHRAKKRYAEAREDGEATIIKRKAGRPSLDGNKQSPDSLVTRSKADPYTRESCILCQQGGGKLSRVELKTTGTNMLEVAKKLEDKGFFRRLNEISKADDAIANEVTYHNNCWGNAKSKVRPRRGKSDNIAHTLSEIEVMNFVLAQLHDPAQPYLDINMVNDMYKEALLENGENRDDIAKDYKKKLKEFLTNLDLGIIFVKPKQKNKSEQIITERMQSQAVSTYNDNNMLDDDYQAMWKIAKCIRADILASTWNFEGQFDNYTPPKLLTCFLKWIIVGQYMPGENVCTRQKSMDGIVGKVTQLVTQNVKTNRQIGYKQKMKSYNTIETPLSVGISMYLYHNTRSKKLLNFISDLNIGVNYEKVISIKKAMASSIQHQRNNTNGVYIPSGFLPGKTTYFAIDNVDLKIDTPDGKNQLHGTVIAAYQEQSESDAEESAALKLSIKRQNKANSLQGYPNHQCYEPPKKNINYFDYRNMLSTDHSDRFQIFDTVWTLLKSLCNASHMEVPTWAAYNSLISDTKPLTLVSTLPIIGGSPTEWNNLYTAIREADKLRKELLPDRKTIISFDLQLYAKAVMLQIRPEIRQNCVFRIGELHVVFCYLKVLGKMIDGSGLDQSFEEAGIYGNTTMGQIKDGKHMYRALECHMVLYLSLYKAYIESMVNENVIIEKDWRESITNAIINLRNHKLQDKDQLIRNHDEVMDTLKNTNFREVKIKFDKELQFQAKFYQNYMSMFEILLLFIRASRQQCWELHLEALHAMTPYFFAFDMLNYARLTPVYLSQMAELKDKDKATWEVLKRGNFSVNKSSVPFSAIGADHGLEQQNRSMKVLGGIKGIANNQAALDEFFMTAGEMVLLIDQFSDQFNIRCPKNAKEHYQLSGSKNKRISNNTQKLITILRDHNLSFEKTENLFNVVTNKVMENDNTVRFLNAMETGKAKYQQFIGERLLGEKSIWDTITKEKIPSFSCNNKQVNIIVNKEIVNLKEERKLMSRFLIALRSRPDIDLSFYLGNYELSVVPRSLFAVDGTLIKSTDKATIAKELRKLYSEEDKNVMLCNEDSQLYKVIIFDAMAIVNRINIKKSKIRTCSDFADVFIEKVLDECFGFDEVRIIFDRYVKDSLKTQTRIGRSKGITPTIYRVMDETKIDNLETKTFLSAIETKEQLTVYLNEKIAAVFSEKLIRYVVVYNSTCTTNIADIDPSLGNHSQEEADTSIVLHAIDVTRRNPFSELTISCSDTDVLLILLNYFDEICSTTIFHTQEHDMPLKPLAEKLGNKICKSLLGFHALTGSDQTGKFFGFSKLTCWQTFMNLPQKTLTAFESLGSVLNENVERELANFVLDLYLKHRPSSVTTLAALRWHLFSINQSESNRLPPTEKAFKQTIMRAHYTSLQWKSSHLVHPDLPHPNEYGWKWNQSLEIFEPIMTTNPPAPESIIELLSCGCKTGCKTDRCKCRKNDLLCTEMCQCTDCENIENEFETPDFLADIDMDD